MSCIVIAEVIYWFTEFADVSNCYIGMLASLKIESLVNS
jgi:hypothetical protein